MKHTSIADWNNSERHRLYELYIEGIWDQLPHALQCLCGYHTRRVYLFDSNVEAIDVGVGERTVKITLDGEAIDEQGWRRGARFFLRYDNVVFFRSMSNPEGSLPGPAGYGDLGYDEVELIAEGVFEHRLLFSTGIELAVRFGEFFLEYTDSPQ